MNELIVDGKLTEQAVVPVSCTETSSCLRTRTAVVQTKRKVSFKRVADSLLSSPTVNYFNVD